MKLDPAQIHEAENALAKAEDAYNQQPDAPQTLDLAVVAHLKAQVAEAHAASMAANEKKARALKDIQSLQEGRLTAAQVEAQRAQEEAKKAQEEARNATSAAQSAQATADSRQQELSKTKEQLAVEQQKRQEAENKLKDALATLAKVAAIKDTDRGVVITLQGEVLFKTGQAQLKAEAMLKLDQVAETLRGQERKIVVEGHTDNQGGAGSYNQDLSEKRAAAVKDYLISKGIPADLISSVGYGPTKPVAENTSPEGRAANRRVEIVVQPRK
jgi:outer membrane protein OmpA-like peptidoglycan-associated protein